MVDTHGFDVVVQARGSVAQQALRGAWKSATCAPTPTPPGGGAEPPPEQRIPQFREIPAGTAVGPYTAAGGQVEIPEAGLHATLDPAVDGARLGLGLVVQVQVADPPVPAVALLDLTAEVTAAVPIGVGPDGRNVVMRLAGLPRSAVTCALTGPDPVDARLDAVLADYVHAAYVNGSPGVPVDPAVPVLPHEVDALDQVVPLPFGSGYTLDTHLELYDDPADPAHRITVSRPDPAHVAISLPVYLRVFHVRRTGLAPALADPMGVETRLQLLVTVERPPGVVRLRFDTATVTVGPLVPAPGVEGTSFTANDALVPGGLLGTLLATRLQQQASDLVTAFGPREVAVPSADQVAAAIGDLFHAELVVREHLTLWGPSDSSSPVVIADVATRVLPDTLVIAVNAQPGADLAAVTDVVPPDRDFAVALRGGVVQDQIAQARATNGWADADLPRRVTEDDTEADVRELDVALVPGAIRMTGEITVVDAILGSIDVDASFQADVGLHWEPDGALDPDGVQTMGNHLIGDPDVDPEASVAFWVIAIILAIVTWGAGSILLGIVILVVAAVVSAVAGSVGGDALVDPVTGAVRGITGWPPELARVGRVRAIFHGPVDIQPDGLLLAGTLEVLSSCEETEVRAARSGGPYTGTAQQALVLSAASTSPAAAYRWQPGDGLPGADVGVLPHVYADSGTYVAEHALTIVQPGGAHSRHLTLVHVANVSPTVDAGPDLVVDEGEVVTLVGQLWDVEPGDTHESTWSFGDAQPTAVGTLTETHGPDGTRGTTTVQHAWCDDGTYTVTLRVRDQDGGMGVDTLTVTVRNVPPQVEAGPDVYAYPCTPLTLTGAFTDPGWCDTHSATWDFGDCTPVVRAVVAQTHEPPAGRGTAVAGHVYRTCGTYRVRLVVTDDDGGTGLDDLVVTVTDVANASFEHGFHRTRTGDVANAWDGYVLAPAGGVAPGSAVLGSTVPGEPVPGGARHVWSESVLDGGRRAQGLRAAPGERTGVLQRVGANPGWEYQLTARHTGDPALPGVALLGVDPDGGTDPAAPGVVWDAGGPVDDWSPLTVRVTAAADAVTVFLEVAPADGAADEPSVVATHATQPTGRRGAQGWFDAVALLAVQPTCPQPTEPTEPTEPAEPRRACLALRRLKPGQELRSPWEDDGFTLETDDGRPIEVVAEGVDGEPALWAHPGLTCSPPFVADRVLVALHHHGGDLAQVRALDAAGDVVDAVTVAPAQDLVTLDLRGAGIVRVHVAARSAEVSLARLCAVAGDHRPGRDGERPPGDRPVATHGPDAAPAAAPAPPAPPAAAPAPGPSPRALASAWSRTASGGGCCG